MELKKIFSFELNEKQETEKLALIITCEEMLHDV